MPFHFTSYTPLSVASVYIATGATVTLNGGAIAVSGCLNVAGSLNLIGDVDGQLDNGTSSTTAFAADPSVPQGTDCSVVPQGFTPRVCGPGQVYVSGTVTVQGLYASLWASTTVAAGGYLKTGANAFLWGSVANYGTIESKGPLYLHGGVSNMAAARASFEKIRADFWTTTPGTKNVTVTLVNNGELVFVRPKVSGSNHEFASTKDDGSQVLYVTLQIVNYNSLTIAVPRGLSGITSAVLAFDIVNHGTTTWSGSQLFFGVGVVYNYGVVVANQAAVEWISYVSEGGSLKQINGGSFGLGVSFDMERRLKSLGLLGPFVATVQMRDTVIESDGSRGDIPVVVLHSPLEVFGDVTVAVGATLRNEIPYSSTALQRVSTGRLVVRGRYEAGLLEVFEGRHDRVVVSSSGELFIGEKAAVVMKSDAAAELQAGAMTVVKGSLTMRRNGDGMVLMVSPSSITLDGDRISGDFDFPAMAYNDFL